MQKRQNNWQMLIFVDTVALRHKIRKSHYILKQNENGTIHLVFIKVSSRTLTRSHEQLVERIKIKDLNTL